LMAYLLYGNRRKMKRIYFCLFCSILAIWLLLNSRTDYLSIFVVVLVLIMFHRYRWRYISIIASFLFLGIIAIHTIPLLKAALRLERGMTFREDLWQAAYRMILESPILGKGPGFYDRFKFMYMDPGIGRIAAGTLQNTTAHNTILMRAVDLGIGAAILQILFFAIPIFVFLKSVNEYKNSEHYHLYIALGLILIELELRSFFDTSGGVFVLIVSAIILKMPRLIRLAEHSS
jgi:O-antigen ligase